MLDHVSLAAEKIDQITMDQMRSWRHSGFSVDKSVYIPPHDTTGLERLAQYILRCPFSLARVVRLTDDGSVIYRAEQDHCRRFPGPASADLRGGPRRLPGLQGIGFSGRSDSTHSRQRRASGAVLRLVLDRRMVRFTHGGMLLGKCSWERWWHAPGKESGSQFKPNSTQARRPFQLASKHNFRLFLCEESRLDVISIQR
jgi:hypothetical protein